MSFGNREKRKVFEFIIFGLWTGLATRTSRRVFRVQAITITGVMVTIERVITTDRVRFMRINRLRNAAVTYFFWRRPIWGYPRERWPARRWPFGRNDRPCPVLPTVGRFSPRRSFVQTFALSWKRNRTVMNGKWSSGAFKRGLMNRVGRVSVAANLGIFSYIV